MPTTCGTGVLGPAALPSARVDSAGDVIPDRAEPYEYADGRFVHAVQLERSVSAAADGGVLFSARDIAPWSAALAGERLVSRTLMAQATTGALLTTGRQVPYGFGWFVERTAGHPMQRHAGRVPGFGAFLDAPRRAGTVGRGDGEHARRRRRCCSWRSPPRRRSRPARPSSACRPRAMAAIPGPCARAQVLERGAAPLNPEWFAPEMQVLLRSGGEGFQASLPGTVAAARSPRADRILPCAGRAPWCATARRLAATSRTISSAGPRTTGFSGRRRHDAATIASTKRQITSLRIRSAAITNSSTV